MNIRTLETFLKVADLENFTRAAAELDYVQSTVTNQIRQLEEELGFPLFDRIGKHVYLTPSGKEFRPYAEDVLRTLQKVQTLGKSPEEMRGALRFGTIESLLFSSLVSVLPDYQQIYRNVDFQLKIGHIEDLMLWLRRNELDMIYISGSIEPAPDLMSCYCRREEVIFVASPSHPLTRRKHVTFEEFLQWPRIDLERTGYCNNLLRRLAADRGLVPARNMVVDNTKAIADMLKQGSGLSFLPEYSVADDISRGLLIRLPVDVGPLYYYSQLLCHKSKWLPPFTEGLVSLIKKARPER